MGTLRVLHRAVLLFSCLCQSRTCVTFGGVGEDQHAAGAAAGAGAGAAVQNNGGDDKK
jgi:hypothetical protein